MSETLKESADRLISLQGKVRGEKFRTHATYILSKKGDDGLKAIEKKMEEIGYPFKFKEIRSLDWYPVGYSPLIILLTKVLFSWTDKEIFDMGYSAPKHSFLFKMTLKWAVSIKRMTEESPGYWRKHYDFGKIEAVDVDTEKKEVVARISGFKLDPVMCPYLQGYVLRMLQYVIKEKTRIEESKCVHKGDDYEEYTIKW